MISVIGQESPMIGWKIVAPKLIRALVACLALVGSGWAGERAKGIEPSS